MRSHAIVEIWKCYGWRDGIKGIIYALYYLLTKYVARRKLLVRNIFDFRMYLNLSDPGISRTLILFGKRELEHRYILQHELQEGMTIWDIGANIGYYAVMEAKIVGSSGKIYAVEPSFNNYKLLQKNIRLNHCDTIVETYNIAISNNKGKSEFFLSEQSNLNTFHPTLYRDGMVAKNLSGETVLVDTMDVPGFIKGREPINFVRMDIEGHEVEVFESIVEAVVKYDFSAKILFETHFTKYHDEYHSMRKQLRRLFDVGYFPKIMVSSDERKAHFHKKGYMPDAIIKTDSVERGIYRDVSKEDAETFICDTGGVRAVLLEWK